MKRNEFLSELSWELEVLPRNVRSEILHDFDEHFASGLEQGRSEEEIAESLGDPRVLGRELRIQYGAEGFNAPPPPPPPPQPRPQFSIMRSLWMTFVMGMFNLIFILGPFFALLGVLLGFWAAAFGMSLAGVAAVIASLIPFAGDAHAFITDSGLSFITIMTGSVACTSLGLLFGIACWYVSKAFLKITGRYLSWNFRVIIGRRY